MKVEIIEPPEWNTCGQQKTEVLKQTLPAYRRLITSTVIRTTSVRQLCEDNNFSSSTCREQDGAVGARSDLHKCANYCISCIAGLTLRLARGIDYGTRIYPVLRQTCSRRSALYIQLARMIWGFGSFYGPDAGASTSLYISTRGTGLESSRHALRLIAWHSRNEFGPILHSCVGAHPTLALSCSWSETTPMPKRFPRLAYLNTEKDGLRPGLPRAINHACA